VTGTVATQQPVDRVAERQLVEAAARLGWSQLGTPPRLVALERGTLQAQVWWNRVSRRYEWDLVAVGTGDDRGWINAATPSGHETSALAAIEAAAGELASAKRAWTTWGAR
jgi:hypothetical protein